MLLIIGAPLSEINLKPMDSLAEEIKQWILNKSTQKAPVENVVETSDQDKSAYQSPTAASRSQPRAQGGAAGDDLYEF